MSYRCSRLETALETLGVRRSSSGSHLETLPFINSDITAGTENELQVAVIGSRSDVDLPLAIDESRYYANVVRRAAAGESPERSLRELQQFLDEKDRVIWENSWVRFPYALLSPYAMEVLEQDLRRVPGDPLSPLRSDSSRFVFKKQNEDWVRVPVSYLVKLALADLLGRQCLLPRAIQDIGEKLMQHFSNDNSSPETFSFYVTHAHEKERLGHAVSTELALRLLLTSLLVEWANKSFDLEQNGQVACVYLAPHPPQRQKQLNRCISDSFYRELFMSPCLSGFDDGEKKRDYMHLCHQVLSRSQLNAVAKLREAGIIMNDLVSLPNTSNISLANNGTHLSLGSRQITRSIADHNSGFTEHDEKILGDLVIKISEHFLPLFVGTYTAAPYRIDFEEFHPERVLGFLPHELDFTHLRMLWRTWREKAQSKVFGQAVTPYGPEPLDSTIARVFGLKGDFVDDFRLLDYPVAWLCTSNASGLDGQAGNVDRLKSDLEVLGVYDHRMSLYLPFRLREFSKMGFSGFEGRHYSLFAGISEDFGKACELQQLITILAFRYISDGDIAHSDIPDDPVSESERRQMFFSAAVGNPWAYIRKAAPNKLLQRVLAKMGALATSSTHPNYFKVSMSKYRMALLTVLREDAREVVQSFGFDDLLEELEQRIRKPEMRASGKLLSGILNTAAADDAFRLSGNEFNLAAEDYYRNGLRQEQLRECFRIFYSIHLGTFPSKSSEIPVHEIFQKFLSRDASVTELRELINEVLFVIASKVAQSEGTGWENVERDGTPIHSSGVMAGSDGILTR